MKNGKLPTWFVVRWIETHPKDTARAPETDVLHATDAEMAYDESDMSELGVSFSFLGVCLPYARKRSDWTICDENGQPVRLLDLKNAL